MQYTGSISFSFVTQEQRATPQNLNTMLLQYMLFSTSVKNNQQGIALGELNVECVSEVILSIILKAIHAAALHFTVRLCLWETQYTRSIAFH